ncbi:MAG: hypothetical protein DRN15_00320 [Thermoprotei archaeon]|nr:MAG: hypothetical protein DRM97_02435 [Thermoprotei archaeon]RLF25139.1 MAG: hypothetical protein DRN15_00320 [Thermoprotei archaeon]
MRHSRVFEAIEELLREELKDDPEAVRIAMDIFRLFHERDLKAVRKYVSDLIAKELGEADVKAKGGRD